MNSGECTFSVISASMKRATWSSTAFIVSGGSGTAFGATSAGTGVITSGGVSWNVGGVAVATVVDAGAPGVGEDSAAAMGRRSPGVWEG